MSSLQTAYSFLSFLGFLMCCIPLPWHLEAWNTGTVLYMFWTGLACLNGFINSIIWNGNAINWAPVWCDISSRIIVAIAVAIPAASLCINRRLYYISSVSTVTVSSAERRRHVIVDLSIGILIPLVQIPLQYVVQGHRFNIFEDIGCYPFTYEVLAADFLVGLTPIVIGLVSAVYCVLSIRAFNKRRMQFNELLASNNNLSANRYWRLMGLAMVEVAGTVPIGLYGMGLNAKLKRQPYISWENVHSGFSRVDQIPALLWRSNARTRDSLEMTRWLPIVCAIIFFAFFGFADEARKNYRHYLFMVAKKVGLSSYISSMSSGSQGQLSTGQRSKNFMTSRNGSIPVFVRKSTTRKRDSFGDLSSTSSYTENKSYDEKKFSPDLSYGAMSIKDAGGALADVKPPEPAAIRDRSIEISSERRVSSASSDVSSIPEITVHSRGNSNIV